MPDIDPQWRLVGFLERFDTWADQQSPSDDVRPIVMAWILSRCDDPYHGVRREPGFENLWYGVVPDSQDGKGQVVTCSYWIEESQHAVRCDSFATLSWPA